MATEEFTSVPVVPIVNALKLVTVPPLPEADNVPVELKAKPDPIVTSPGAAEVAEILPNNLLVVIFCILA